ncbi:MAG TPA: GNAT family N-acetyltransferase [Acetobacteraceae bacterium]|nr:GNAT family N-acetyltransferase [Acetobacteraceae bacterium]
MGTLEPKFITMGSLAPLYEVAAQTFGADFLQTTEKVDEDTRILAAQEPSTGGIIGFVTARKLGKKMVSSILKTKEPFTGPHDITVCDDVGAVGVIQSIAVDPEFQGRGIGTKLLAQSEKIISAEACSVAIVPAWKYDDTVNIHGILSKAGYKEWIEIKQYWKEDCDKSAFVCPQRTVGCMCSVVFYRKTLLKRGLPERTS